MLLFDAHLDLSMNAMEWNRDLTRSLEEVRDAESGMDDKRDRGAGVVTLDEMRRGSIGLCLATQIARYSGPQNPLPGWSSPEIAWSMTQAQLAWYQAVEEAGGLVQIVDRTGLDRVAEQWRNAIQAHPQPESTSNLPIGYVLTLEGADSLITLKHLERAFAKGLRAIGPAHYGAGRYAPGTGLDGSLEPAGRDLLRAMQDLGMALDVTHLTDRGFWEALDLFDGVVWASHSNCRTLVPNQRQLSDEQLRALFQRDAVIGAACDAWMLWPDWVRGQTRSEIAGVTLQHVADHIDYVCQLAGKARHSGIGSDLDGGFGREQCPLDVDSIARLQQLQQILRDRGYPEDDLTAIMHGNWLRRVREALPG